MDVLLTCSAKRALIHQTGKGWRDKFIVNIMLHSEANRKPTQDEERHEEQETWHNLTDRHRLFLTDGILFWKVQWKREHVEQIVIPYTHRKRVVEGIGGEMGHFGVEKTLELARDKVFWPRMTQAVEQKCR